MATVTGSVGTAINAAATVADNGTMATEGDQATTAQSILDDLATIRDSTGVGGKVSRTGDSMSDTLIIAATSPVTALEATGGPGNTNGVQGTGQGTGRGVVGTGGASSGAGVVGGGGLPNGVGVAGQGRGAGFGMQGTGDSTAGATGAGGHFVGADEGNGVEGEGGPSAGAGVKGTGGPGSAGVTGIGGTTSGPGGNFTATAGNSTGVVGNGHGSGAGGDFSGGATAGTPAVISRNGPVQVSPELSATADPGDNGRLYATNICKSWGQIESDGVGGKGVEDSYNLATLAFAGSGTVRFLLTFARPMTNAFYSVNVTLHGTPGIAMKAVPFNLTANGFDIIIYNSTSVAQDPAGAAFNVSYQIFGRST